MAAPNEYYVDPLNGDDTTGDGLADGTAWKTTDKALSTITVDATDGDRINVKDSATDTLTVKLPLATYAAASSNNAPLIIQGYTSTAGDGGIGHIAGGGNVILFEVAYDSLSCVDMKFTGGLTDATDGSLIKLDNNCSFLRCEFADTAGTGLAVDTDDFGIITECYFHNLGGGVSGSRFLFNTWEDATNKCEGLVFDGFGSGVLCMHNHIWLNSTAGNGIRCNHSGVITNNRLFNNTAGTGNAIQNTGFFSVISNNVIEGWSGGGGGGIHSQNFILTQGNAVFNCSTDYKTSSLELELNVGTPDNESLAATAFVDATNGDLNLKDVENIKEGSLPLSFPGLADLFRLDKGTGQLAASGGGGAVGHSAMLARRAVQLWG